MTNPTDYTQATLRLAVARYHAAARAEEHQWRACRQAHATAQGWRGWRAFRRQQQWWLQAAERKQSALADLGTAYLASLPRQH